MFLSMNFSKTLVKLLIFAGIFLFQVIQATIEKHKQNSETFRAFNSSFSQDEDHVPDSSVSLSA